MRTQQPNSFDGRGAPGDRPGDARPDLAPFECRFRPRLGAVGVVRRALGRWLGAHRGVDADAVDDLLIACSELCTNAVRSASHAGGTVAVRARQSGDAVVLEVEDDGAGFSWPLAHRIQDVPEQDEHGRGLFIVTAITDEMEVEVATGRTVVRCTKRHALDRQALDHRRRARGDATEWPPRWPGAGRRD